MQLTYNNRDYNIIILKKAKNRNTYIRVKKDLNIYVTTSLFATNRSIEKLIESNYSKIVSMIEFQEKKIKNNNGFFYLGKQYTLIYCDVDKIIFLLSLISKF